MRRALATLLTLGLLSGMLFAVILGLMVAFDIVSLTLAVALVIVFNLLLLLISPKISDFIYRWFYGLEWISLEELRERSPASAAVVEDVTAEYDYNTPKLGYIDDRNPNAFTYGSARFNARIVLTEGCFEFLDDEELASVMGHELGHVTSRDFITMTLANTIVQLLYLVAIYSIRYATLGSGGGGGGGGRSRVTGILYAVGIVSYVFWIVAQYMVLYLGRVREYAADAFAADKTHPDALSMALVKIAYGIVSSDENPELVNTTRNIGIMDVESSRDDGLVYHNMQETGTDEELLLRAFLFDLKSPWATVLEVTSTHPLTGKRVRALSEHPAARRFDFDEIERRFPVDRRRLYREFGIDLAVLGLPTLLAVGFPLAYLGLVGVEILPFSWPFLIGGWLLVIGLAMALRTVYKYPRGEPEETTVLELLADPYASPVRGQPVRLQGELIGRGQAGYRFSEDLMFRDRSGLMYLIYESWLPWLGNFLFAIRRVPELVGQNVTVEGWFLRGIGPSTGLRRLYAGDETIRGFVHYAGLVSGVILAVLGVVVIGAGLVF